jgi:hypothetical protein
MSQKDGKFYTGVTMLEWERVFKNCLKGGSTG